MGTLWYGIYYGITFDLFQPDFTNLPIFDLHIMH